MQVELLTPERALYRGDASMVIARTLEGEIGFLDGHAPLLGGLLPGRLRIVKADGSEEVAAVHGGFVEVCDGRVVILADEAELVGRPEGRPTNPEPVNTVAPATPTSPG